MKLILIATVLALSSAAQAFDGTPTEAQYGGPPMWDRNYGNPEYRRLAPLPPPRRYGPQFEPCIYGGDCRGPRYGVPPFRDIRPRRYDLYEED